MLGILFVNGCSTLPRNPVPIEATLNAQVTGMPDVRAWSGMIEPAFQKDIIESVKSEPPGMFSRTADDSSAYQALAVSGAVRTVPFLQAFSMDGLNRDTGRPLKLLQVSVPERLETSIVFIP